MAPEEENLDSYENRFTTDESLFSGLTVDFSETARVLFAAGSVAATLAQVVSLAVVTIEGCDFAGLSLGGQEVEPGPAPTDPLVTEIDYLQYRIGEGPGLDAITQGLMIYADDLADDPRWSQFGPAAAAAGMRSMLALPLATIGSVGALNLYARYPAAFGVVDRAKGVILASLAGLAVSAARSHEDEERRLDNLHAALGTREIIGQAQGILIERERITANQAFDVLRRASQHLNRKLRDVAQDLVDTGERPETGFSG
jgi:hypothetical protein